MKRLIVILFAGICVTAYSQQITCKVIDANSGAALPYATVMFKDSNQFFYTDSLGEFSFYRNAAINNDTVTVEYISYATAIIPQNTLSDGLIIKLQPETHELQNVTVTSCNKWKITTVNKIPGKAKEYVGPGPETRLIIISRFTNTKNLAGYIKEIEFYSGSFIEKAQVPVRIHWYKWNNVV